VGNASQGMAAHMVEIKESDLLWIMWTFVLLLFLMSLWLWLPVSSESKVGKLLKTLIPAFISASFYGVMAIQATHVHHNMDLLYDFMIPEAAAVAVIGVTYKLNRPKKTEQGK